MHGMAWHSITAAARDLERAQGTWAAAAAACRLAGQRARQAWPDVLQPVSLHGRLRFSLYNRQPNQGLGWVQEQPAAGHERAGTRGHEHPRTPAGVTAVQGQLQDDAQAIVHAQHARGIEDLRAGTQARRRCCCPKAGARQRTHAWHTAWRRAGGQAKGEQAAGACRVPTWPMTEGESVFTSSWLMKREQAAGACIDACVPHLAHGRARGHGRMHHAFRPTWPMKGKGPGIRMSSRWGSRDRPTSLLAGFTYSTRAWHACTCGGKGRPDVRREKEGGGREGQWVQGWVPAG